MYHARDPKRHAVPLHMQKRAGRFANRPCGMRAGTGACPYDRRKVDRATGRSPLRISAANACLPFVRTTVYEIRGGCILEPLAKPPRVSEQATVCGGGNKNNHYI